MGGLGPGIGGLEILVIGLIALLVVGPKDLPVLMHKVGQWMARARNMAAEFRASFDEMARQTELEELRKEVEALKTANPVHRLGAEADAAFKDIEDGLNAPPSAGPPRTPMAAALAPEPSPAAEPAPDTAVPPTAKKRASPNKTTNPKPKSTKTKSKTAGATAPRKITASAGKAAPKRTKKVEL